MAPYVDDLRLKLVCRALMTQCNASHECDGILTFFLVEKVKKKELNEKVMQS